MRRKAFSISLISIGCLLAWQDLARAEPEDLSLAAQTANLVQNFMTSRADERSSIIPAMSVAIGRDGTLLYADGYGQAGPGRTATAATIYMVGSITKQFTAAAILRLIEQGATINGRGEKLAFAGQSAERAFVHTHSLSKARADADAYDVLRKIVERNIG